MGICVIIGRIIRLNLIWFGVQFRISVIAWLWSILVFFFLLFSNYFFLRFILFKPTYLFCFIRCFIYVNPVSEEIILVEKYLDLVWLVTHANDEWVIKSELHRAPLATLVELYRWKFKPWSLFGFQVSRYIFCEQQWRWSLIEDVGPLRYVLRGVP